MEPPSFAQIHLHLAACLSGFFIPQRRIPCLAHAHASPAESRQLVRPYVSIFIHQVVLGDHGKALGGEGFHGHFDVIDHQGHGRLPPRPH